MNRCGRLSRLSWACPPVACLGFCFVAGSCQKTVGHFALTRPFESGTCSACCRSADRSGVRARFKPELVQCLNNLITSVTKLSIILVGATLIREREYGAIEHLLVMPVTLFEMMAIIALLLIGAVLSFYSLRRFRQFLR